MFISCVSCVACAPVVDFDLVEAGLEGVVSSSGGWVLGTLYIVTTSDLPRGLLP